MQWRSTRIDPDHRAGVSTVALMEGGHKMDIGGLKQFFGQNILVSADGKDFVGTLQAIPGSQDAVSLRPLDDATANNYIFAINGVAALSVSSISFVQKLDR
jgi:hypothetical protein